MKRRAVLVVFKRSNLETYLASAQRRGHRRVRKLIGALRRGHDAHQRTMLVVRAALRREGAKTFFVRRDGLSAFDERAFDLVVTVGGDGTLLATAPYLAKTPVFAVNSAPEDSIGFFAAADLQNVAGWLAAIFAGDVAPHRLFRMAVEVNGVRLSPPVLNDVLFAHPSPGATTRCWLRPPSERLGEEQRSSGLWVATAAGSTGAIRSAGGRVLPLASRDLEYVVREPYVGTLTPHRWVQGEIRPGQKLLVEPRMEKASLFLDGPSTEIPLRFGDRVAFCTHPRALKLFGHSAAMRRVHAV